jgi:small-conductance mechanosensitive channel
MPTNGMINIKKIIENQSSTTDKNPWEKLVNLIQQDEKEIQALSPLTREKEELKRKEQLLDERQNNSNKNTSDKQMLDKILNVIKQNMHTIDEIETLRQQILITIKDHLKKLTDLIADPTQSKLKKSSKTSPTYDDLQEISEQIMQTENAIVEKEKNNNATLVDIYQRKNSINAITEEIKTKKNDQEKLALSTKKDRTLQGEYLDEQMLHLTYRKQLEELHSKEASVNIRLFATESTLLKKQLDILRQQYQETKQALRVDDTYLKKVEKTFEQSKQDLLNELTIINELLIQLNNRKSLLQNHTIMLMKTYGLSAATFEEYKNWSKDPQTAHEWEVLANVGLVSIQELYIDTRIEESKAQRDLIKSKIQQQEIETEIIRSWNALTCLRINNSTEVVITKEIKKYEPLKTEIISYLSSAKDRRERAINELHTLSTKLERIKKLSNDLINDSQKIFENDHQKQSEIIRSITLVKDVLRKKIDLNAQLIELYSTIINTIELTNKKISTILHELSTENFWKRSRQSIEWAEIQTFLPDTKKFITALAHRFMMSFTYESMKTFSYTLWNYIKKPTAILYLSFLLAIVIGLYFVIKKLLPLLKTFITELRAKSFMLYPSLSTALGISSLVISFLGNHFTSIYIWTTIFIIIKFNIIAGQFSASLFYLASIPLSIYYLNALFTYIFTKNKESYAYISAPFAARFAIVIPLFFYATSALYFFREAFLPYNKIGSQLPTVLLAINFILLQVTLLALIGKEQILALIPDSKQWGITLQKYIDQYYYPFLLVIISIIVMSNPYVGYGRQVFYIVSRLIVTIILIPFFIFLHTWLKQTSSSIFFFSTEGELSKERFESGKTWYGVFVVVTFILFVLISLIIILWVWGSSLTMQNMREWLNYELYSPGIDEGGRKVWVTIFSLVRVVAYIIGGFVVAYITNNFILKRIFDPIIAGPGVQNTILTLTRYTIIIIAILIGLQNIGLGNLTTKIGIFLALMGFAIKEPLGDFFAYFIILVQRPIKIGDLIMIDTDNLNITGIVRQINARSTIIRNRNSTPIIIPNSQITNNIIFNWSHIKSFIAFEDILITVSYNADPVSVKKIIHQMLDENNTILKNPSPIVWLKDLTDNGFQFLIRGYIPSEKAMIMWDIQSAIRLEIVKTLQSNNIKIACPTRCVTVKKESCEN